MRGRYRRRYADDDSSDGYHVGGGVSSRDKDRERDGKDKGRGTGLAAAVASVTAAAKAVEEELRAQLEAKDQALRREFCGGLWWQVYILRSNSSYRCLFIS